MGFENFSPKIEQEPISEDVKNQLENLGLTLEEIKGVILDIGANDGSFGRELTGVTDAEIFSIDNIKDEDTPEDVIIADAKELPFEDEKFDKVVSHASMPNVFIGMYNEESPESSMKDLKETILQTFNEMLRVIKPGAMVVMAPVKIGNTYDSERAMINVLSEVIDEIQSNGVNANFELIREVENPQNHEKHQEYRLTLMKKVA